MTLRILAVSKLIEDEKWLFPFLTTILQWTGAVIDLFFVNRSKPGWSFGAWDSSYVQDWQEQVWVHCTELDSEVCHGLNGKSHLLNYLFMKNSAVISMYDSIDNLFLCPLKFLKTGPNEVCPVLKTKEHHLCETRNWKSFLCFVLWWNYDLMFFLCDDGWDGPPILQFICIPQTSNLLRAIKTVWFFVFHHLIPHWLNAYGGSKITENRHWKSLGEDVYNTVERWRNVEDLDLARRTFSLTKCISISMCFVNRTNGHHISRKILCNQVTSVTALAKPRYHASHLLVLES